MASARLVTNEERRARLVVRQLQARHATALDVADSLVGLHSSDPASVFLSLWARIEGFAAEMLEDELYVGRDLARMLGMRRTMFVVPLGVAAVMSAACTRALVGAERRRLVGLIQDQMVAADAARWLDEVTRSTLEALSARGTATAAELKQDVPELAETLTFGAGTTWARKVGMSTRVLFLLATEAAIIRGRPRGTWLSSQYEWAVVEDWFGSPLETWSTEAARVDLVRRWLGCFGPGTFEDVKWWTGWGVADTRATLESLRPAEVELEGDSTGYLLPEDVEAVESPASTAFLLPALDPTTMGWRGREWYLGPDASALFDRNGNAGPTVWWAGRVVGGWAQLASGRVVVGYLADPGREAVLAVEEQAARLTEWLDGTQVKPRFPAPLQKGLSAGA